LAANFLQQREEEKPNVQFGFWKAWKKFKNCINILNWAMGEEDAVYQLW
jgi:hypothetical protein